MHGKLTCENEQINGGLNEGVGTQNIRQFFPKKVFGFSASWKIGLSRSFGKGDGIFWGKEYGYPTHFGSYFSKVCYFSQHM